MHQPDRQQGTGRLYEQARPFYETDLRSADENPLTARIERGFQRGGDLTLCYLLALTAWR
jgi:hypothetical protein